jgi:NAD(P)H-dependent FMN reductase
MTANLSPGSSTERSVRILGLSGSLRRSSLNSALLRAAAEVAPPGVDLDIGSIADLPLYNADLEADPPEAVRRFRAAVGAADALLLATPEYNYSIPGGLKNALDWVSRPRRGPLVLDKPVGLVGAGGRMGTARAQLAWLPVFAEMGLASVPQPEVYVMMGRGFDDEGRVVDEALRSRLRQRVASLAAAVRARQSAGPTGETVTAFALAAPSTPATPR